MLKFLVLSIFAFTAFATQDIPIPPRPDGFSLGSTTPTLHLEAFFDLTCSDCQATWKVFGPIIMNEYNIATNQTLRFTVHLLPLQMHVNAYIAAQGANTIYDHGQNVSDVYTYFDLMFTNQANFYTPAVLQLSRQQCQDNLVALVNENMPTYASVFAAGLEYGNTQDTETRISWKYACSRGVATTPTFMANGIIVNGAGNFQADDWRNFLNGGYQAAAARPKHLYS